MDRKPEQRFEPILHGDEMEEADWAVEMPPLTTSGQSGQLDGVEGNT